MSTYKKPVGFISSRLSKNFFVALILVSIIAFFSLFKLYEQSQVENVAETFLRAANIALERNDIDRAIAQYSKVSKLYVGIYEPSHPRFIWIRRRLANTYLMNSNYKDARQILMATAMQISFVNENNVFAIRELLVDIYELDKKRVIDEFWTSSKEAQHVEFLANKTLGKIKRYYPTTKE